jgi:hypothetical protein
MKQSTIRCLADNHAEEGSIIMRIELIGCTSAGKSTLTSRVLRICRDRGIDASTGYDFVLRQARLDWVKSRLLRALLVNLISLCVGLAAYRRNLEFYRFALRMIARLPSAIAWPEKLHIGRIVVRNIGIDEISRRAADRQIVVLDEGPLQTAHYLFVHVAVEPNTSDLASFIRLVPLPDMVVYVTQSESVLIERTLQRGHKRIPDRSYANVQRFIRRAVATFDELEHLSAFERRLIVVDRQPSIIVGQGYAVDPLFDTALGIVRAGINADAADNTVRMMCAASFQEV